MDQEREQMIIRNLPLVSFVVGKMADDGTSNTIDREEAIAYGIEGLIQAVDGFDGSRGTTFASYAVLRIRGAILDAGRKMDILPRSLRKHAREIEKANLELAAMLGRWPTPKEIAMKLGMQISELRQLLSYTATRLVSLEKLMTEDTAEGTSHWEAPDPDELADPAARADRKASMQILAGALSTLSSRDQTIIRLRYDEAMPFHEISSLLNLSESRVCQLHKRILSSLKTRLGTELHRVA